MKRLGKKGFTLVECIVSIMVFAVLMLAVGTMISTSLAITAMFMREGREWQDDANEVILREIEPVSGNHTITIEGGGIKVEIDVDVIANDKYTGFFPPPEELTT